VCLPGLLALWCGGEVIVPGWGLIVPGLCDAVDGGWVRGIARIETITRIVGAVSCAVTFRGSRARMMAQVPMALAGSARLAGFREPRAAELPRVASFGLLWRPLCGRRFYACGFSRLCDRLLGVCALLRLCGRRPCACESSPLCGLPLGVCGLLRLFSLRSSWGSSLPPLRFGKGLNLKLLVYARPAFGGFPVTTTRLLADAYY
jgi:hypothetical protein